MGMTYGEWGLSQAAIGGLKVEVGPAMGNLFPTTISTPNMVWGGWGDLFWSLSWGKCLHRFLCNTSDNRA